MHWPPSVTTAELERLRARVDTTVKHATALLAALTSLDDAWQGLLPSVVAMTESERDAYVARLCGYDGALAQRLHGLVESLADVIAGLTTADQGRGWLEHHLARLEAGEDDAA